MKVRRSCYGYLIRSIDALSVYVGISYDLKKRFECHRKVAKEGSRKPLYEEMRSKEMELLVQDRFESVTEARSWERSMIKQLVSNGSVRLLNCSKGGEHPHAFGFDISGSSYAICKKVRRFGTNWVLDFVVEGYNAEVRMFLNDSPAAKSYIDNVKQMMRWRNDASVCIDRRFNVTIKDGRVVKAISAW